MLADVPLFPTQGSSIAGSVDAVFFYILLTTIFFSVLIAGLLITFAVKYRKRPDVDEPKLDTHSFLALEITWTLVPLLLAGVMFFWGAHVYFEQTRQPKSAMDVFVVAKQWMWKFQHMTGRREINHLHVPVNQSIKLIMGSEDVIHSFYVPAFRVKQDVVPGKLTTTWFKPTRTGEFRLFCAEYCGTNHSRMIGSVIVMEQADFERWISGETGATPAEAGKIVFEKFGCNTCHIPGQVLRGPDLQGLYNKSVQLATNQIVTADDGYIRESILEPTAKVVAGFQPIMPTFKGLLTEEQVLQLIAYIRSMADQKTGGTGQGLSTTSGDVSTSPTAPQTGGV